MTHSPEVAWLLVAVGWLLCCACLYGAGRPQQKDAGSSLLRFVWIVSGLSSLAAAPLAVWAVCLGVTISTPIQSAVAGALTFLSLICVLPSVMPPVRLRGTREKLPCVDDPLFLARLADLAGTMGVPVPLVRLWPSISGSQQMLAFAGSLPAPQLVVTDGILRRLSPAECDAIVAHELAHIANGSLWLLYGIVPLVCCVATGMVLFYDSYFVGAFGLALIVGLRRLVSRPIELDCDRRAARAMGFPETAAALGKIHAVHPVRNSGWLSLLVYATATHPSRDVRIWALQAAAPDVERSGISVDAAAVQRRRFASAAAALVWFLVMAGSLAAIATDLEPEWPARILFMTALTPSLLMLAAQQKQAAVARRRLGQRRTRLVLMLAGMSILVAMSVAALSLQLPAHDLGDSAYSDAVIRRGNIAILVVLTMFVLVVAGLAWLLWTRARRKLRWDVVIALQVHDFRRGLELGLAKPKLVARDYLLRYNVALARAVCGDRQAAITELEQLWRDKPRFPLAAILLHVLLLDEDEPQRSLEIVRSVAPRLKSDADVQLMSARVLRRLECWDESHAACEQVLAQDPENAVAHATLAALALDREDLPEAQRLIDRALELAPGECYLLVMRAEIALRTLPFEAARDLVAETAAIVRSNPLVFLRSDLARLEQAVADLAPQTAIEPSEEVACPAGQPCPDRQNA